VERPSAQESRTKTTRRGNKLHFKTERLQKAVEQIEKEEEKHAAQTAQDGGIERERGE